MQHPHQQQDSTNDSDSIRFTMIIANNLSEIHRMIGNATKYNTCLERLLSSVMTFKMTNSLMMINDGNDETAASAGTNQKDAMESYLDGFLHNTLQLILHRQCTVAVAA